VEVNSISISNSSPHLAIPNKCPSCNKEFKSLGERQEHLVTGRLQYGDLARLYRYTVDRWV
jgi:hypothetical protein